MAKSGPTRNKSMEHGLPNPGSSAKITSESYDSEHVELGEGVFKAETEGVGKTLSLAEITQATVGEWLPPFEAPDFSSMESACNEEECLPAWMGSYEHPKLQTETVIGADTRRQIDAALLNQFPYNTICRLRIIAKTGKPYLGTGWLGGNRILYTAGHCTWIRNQGGLASRIEVYPPGGGMIVASNWGCTNEWSSTGSAEDDLGCVFLTNPIQRWLGYNHPYDTSTQLQALRLHVVGYPGDKPHGTMWGDANQLIRVYPRQLKYAIDTYGGQSGAPVMTSKGEVVGVHNYGGGDGNLASRLTPAVKTLFQKWWQKSGSTAS